MKNISIRFPNNKDLNFIKTLRARVKEHFESSNTSKYGNATMVWKTVAMLSIYAVPYALFMTGVISNFWLVLGLWIIMGVGKAGIGFSVMHDANHGAYSENPKVNHYMGYLINILGGSAINWKIQHNVLHHTYTNVYGMDEDIDSGIILRLSPQQKHYKLHNIQHIYAWFLYGLMTFLWITTKDFRQLYRYKSMGLTKNVKNFNMIVARMALAKVLYYVVFLVLPIIVLPFAWWQVLICFVAMHYTAGLILACVFQTAHVMPTTSYPEPDETGNLENDWAVHQLFTTANYSPNSKILSWYVGGLNYQIEHHLFPNVCHIHYKKISKIVRETAEEYGLPYNSHPNFLRAVWEHARMLKQLGRATA